MYSTAPLNTHLHLHEDITLVKSNTFRLDRHQEKLLDLPDGTLHALHLFLDRFLDSRHSMFDLINPAY